MKKYLFSIVFILSISLNFYFLNMDTEVIVNDDLDNVIYEEVNDQISIAQSALKKQKNLKEGHHQDNLDVIEEELLPEKSKRSKTEERGEFDENKHPADYEREYEEQRKKYQQDVTEFLERDLGISFESVEAYFEMQKLREKEVSEYMTPKLDGANGEPYLFTLEDNIFIGKLNEKYLTQLKTSFGEDSYQKFIEYRQNYNKKMIRSGNSSYYVEF